jgi:hypothetical protein
MSKICKATEINVVKMCSCERKYPYILTDRSSYPTIGPTAQSAVVSNTVPVVLFAWITTVQILFAPFKRCTFAFVSISDFDLSDHDLE